MEIIKPRKDLLYFVGTGFVLLGFIFFLFFTPFIAKIFYGHWGFLFLALLLSFLPSSKKPLGEVRQYSFGKWISLIALMQISLIALHFALFQEPYTKEILSYGLFPWGWVAVLASAFASVAFLRRENAFGNSLVSPLINSSVDKPIGIIINNTLKFLQSATLILTFALMILLIAQLFGFNPKPPYSNPIPLLALLFLIMLSFSRFYNRLFARISAYSTGPLICVLIVVLALLLAGLNALSAGVHSPMPLPSFFSRLQSYPTITLESISSLGWWLGFTILSGLFIARISGGYSRRALIIATLIFPTFIAIISLKFPSFTLESISPFLRNVIGILGFISTIILFTNKKMLSPFVLNYLPKNGESKFRNPEFLLRKLIQMTLIFLYIYLPAGAFASAAFIFLGIIPFLIFACLLAFNFKAIAPKFK